MNSTIETPAETKAPSFEAILSVEVTGRYATQARELAKDAKRLLNWSEGDCIKLARDFHSDLCRYLNSAQASVKLGDKLNKDGQISLKETVTAMKGNLTDALRIAKGISLTNDAARFGVTPCEGCKYNPLS